MVDQKDLGVIISMMLMLYASDIMGYDRRRPGLSNTAPLDRRYDNQGIKR